MTKEILQFYLDNGLDEVISESRQDYFLEKDKKKAVGSVNPRVDIISSKVTLSNDGVHTNSSVSQSQTAFQKPIANNFIKPIFSTSEALSQLAKRGQEMNNNSGQFVSLNEIVAKAKKMAEGAQNLDQLRKVVENFEGCNLKKMATNTVFCDGNPNSKVMVIGEAPGNHEDLQGIPFCGDSGKLLDEMLRAINLTRKENFYITNVVFWRPPGNRRPTDEELAICRPFVERHIQLMRPEVLVLVGATSLTSVLGIAEPISKIRGQFMDFSPKFLDKTIKTFAIFHPSYLLRQPGKKKVAWQDMLALEKFLKQYD